MTLPRNVEWSCQIFYFSIEDNIVALAKSRLGESMLFELIEVRYRFLVLQLY